MAPCPYTVICAEPPSSNFDSDSSPTMDEQSGLLRYSDHVATHDTLRNLECGFQGEDFSTTTTSNGDHFVVCSRICPTVKTPILFIWYIVSIPACLALFYLLPTQAWRFISRAISGYLTVEDVSIGNRISAVLGCAMQVLFCALLASLPHSDDEKGRRKRRFTEVIRVAVRVTLKVELGLGVVFLLVPVVVGVWKAVEVPLAGVE